MDERILHALDLAAVGEWDDARRAVEGIAEPVAVRLLATFDELRRCEANRTRVRAAVRHELSNVLTIAQANVEGMLDGVVEPTPQRLENVRSALATAAELMKEPPERALADMWPASSERIDVVELVMAGVREMRPIAATKNVEFTCDVDALRRTQPTPFDDREGVERAVTKAMLAAVCDTPPGGAVHVIGWKDGGELLMTVRGDVSSKLLDAVGTACIVDRNGNGITLGVAL